jgi:hypothetical protein
LSALTLTFDALRLYPGPGAAFGAHFGRHGTDDAGAWVERALDAPVTVDLMDLESTLVDLLTTLEIPAGTYRGLGLHLVAAVAVTVDGEELPAVLPAEHMEFLRVMALFTVEEGQVGGLTLTVGLEETLSACVREDGVLILRPVMGTPRCGDDPAEWRGGGGPHGDGDHDGMGGH